jgi:hypothetical protein
VLGFNISRKRRNGEMELKGKSYGSGIFDPLFF